MLAHFSISYLDPGPLEIQRQFRLNQAPPKAGLGSRTLLASQLFLQLG